MKVIKITAMWCSACIIMNNLWNDILKDYNIETESYDYDFDEEIVKSFNPGDILPIFIFKDDDKEIGRIQGEINKDELISYMKGLGVINE